MKAAVNKVYGPPSVIKIQDVAKPEPGPNDLLVKVHYSSVNRTDVGFLRAKPTITRLFSGITKPRYLTVGCEFSGVVEEVGERVSKFKKGDKVFGFDDQNFGGYAEYKVIAEKKMLATVPDDLPLKQAAAALEGAHYALFYIYKIPSSKNTKIFVNGATGAIGSAAVQLLKAKGYYVEASSTTKEVETVKKLGADKVIDWETQDISKAASKCDIYFDSVGKSTFKKAREVLEPQGTYMSSELGRYGQNPLLALLNPLQKVFTKRNIRFPLPLTRAKEAHIIREFLENRAFTPLIDKEYALKDIVEAFEYVESGNKVGNVVVKIR